MWQHDSDRHALGDCDGLALGLTLGEVDGLMLGLALGAIDGSDGDCDGDTLGLTLGLTLGEAEGAAVGIAAAVGASVAIEHALWPWAACVDHPAGQLLHLLCPVRSSYVPTAHGMPSEFEPGSGQ